MSDQAKRQCLTPDELMDYFEGRLEPTQTRAAEEHLADCAECTRQARLLHGFDRAWAWWTAATHGEAHARAEVLRALDAAARQPQYAPWKERLDDWRERWRGRAAALLRFALSPPARREPAHEPAPRGGFWQLALVTALMQAGAPEPSAEREPAAALDRATPQARIAVKTETGEVLVRVYNLRPDEPPPLVLLISEEGRAPMLAATERHPDADHVTAQFEGVEPGEYWAVIEPLGG